jgi:MerR family transcriptional regulator, light-induced transcriptional regulator
MNGSDDGWETSDAKSREGNVSPNETSKRGGSLIWTKRDDMDRDPDKTDGSESYADQLRSEDAARAEGLARTIESEIIPRLLLSHLSSKTIRTVVDAPKPQAIRLTFTDTQIENFSNLVMHSSLPVAVAYVDALIAGGMTAEEVITDVLSTSARFLGTQWDEDRITFVDVTLGLSRLQQLLRAYGPAFEADFAPKHVGQRILLASMPGEQHTFGLSVVEEFFRRDGWDVQSEAKMSRADLLGRARDEWFDVIGLSVNVDESVSLLAALIKALRDVALNRHIRVIVGGCAFLAEPANAIALGADLVARDGREAVLNVERLLDPTKNV